MRSSRYYILPRTNWFLWLFVGLLVGISIGRTTVKSKYKVVERPGYVLVKGPQGTEVKLYK